MPGPLDNLIANLKTMQTFMENRVDQSLNRNLQAMDEMQRERLEKGENNKGEPLKREGASYYPYTPAYTKHKRARGGNVSVVDNKLTGDYHDGITTQKDGKNKVKMYSRDKKERFLPKQYPGNLGLSPEQQDELKQEIFYPELAKAAKEKFTNTRIVK